MMKAAEFRLRPGRRADADDVARYLGDFETARMLSRVPHPYTAEHWYSFLDGWIARGSEDMAVIASVPDDRAIGAVGLVRLTAQSVRLGFWLGAPLRRRGIMRAAVTHILGRTFRASEDMVVQSGYFDDNLPSAALQAQLGFRNEKRGHEFCLATGEERPFTDGLLDAPAFFALYPEEWKKA